jgi:ppGpp synthetase/RelA/SpoT-type nucleotidyltranferase
MDDLIGVRITVPELLDQNACSAAISKYLPGIRWKDRREAPSSGYRAIHGIVRTDGVPLEIQVRTRLQDNWANLVESLADQRNDPGLKYGRGSPGAQIVLSELSDVQYEVEQNGLRLYMYRKKNENASADDRSRLLAEIQALDDAISRTREKAEIVIGKLKNL